MKKFLFLGAMAALLLGTASCSSDMEPVAGDEALVTLMVNLGDGIDSRTISDGTGANTLKFAVYTEDGQHISALDQTVAVENKMATIQTRLTRYHNFKLVFWAQNSSCSAYNTDDMSAITVNYTSVNCNDESRDAFYKMEEVSVADADVNRLIVLTRPFAQINFLASDAAGVVNVNQYKSKVTVTGVPTTLNTLDGSVNGTTDVTFDYATILPNEETLAGYEQYRYVAMNYVLAATAKEMKNEVVLTVKDENNAEVNTVTVANCPVQRNYRTNIIGDLFTMEGKFNIEIDPIYEGEFNLPEKVWDGTLKEPADITGDVIEINDGSELAWVLNNVTNGTDLAGKTFKLTDDINLGMLDWPLVNAQCAFTLDGNGKTIKGLKSTGGNYGGLIGKSNKAIVIRNLTIADSEIDASGRTGDENAAGAFIGWSEIHTNTTIILDNCKSMNVTFGKAQYNGGLVGYSSHMSITNCAVLNDEIISDYAESGNYKGHSGCVVGYGNDNTSITNTSVTDSKITGRNDRGRIGIFYGSAQSSVTIGTGNSVKNVTILGDAATSANLVGSVDARTDKSNDGSVVFE